MLHKLIAATSTPLGQFDSPAAIVDVKKDLSSNVGVATKLETTISQVLGVITIVGGIALVFYFIVGGLNWITAAGDAGKISKAREEMVQAVSGMVLLVAAYGLIGLVGNFLGIHILNPGSAFLYIVDPTKGQNQLP